MRRMTLRGLVVALLAAVAAAGLRLLPVHAQATVPSPEFIVAAMKNQEKPGLALHVRYSRKDGGVVGTPGLRADMVWDDYYIRTTDTIFLKEKVTTTFEPAADIPSAQLSSYSYTSTSLYDRATGELRELIAWDDGSPASGKVTHRLSGQLASVASVESVVSYIVNTPLYDVVKAGQVLDKKELVDGHSCWGVALDVVSGVQRHVVWVDPDIGFCPRRIDTLLQGRLRDRKTLRDYQEVGYGIWFPMGLEFEQFSKTGQPLPVKKVAVTDARVLPIDSSARLEIKMPAGARVDYDLSTTGQKP